MLLRARNHEQWRRWFAWRPMRVNDRGDRVWWEWIEIRGGSVRGHGLERRRLGSDESYCVYRLIDADAGDV